MKSGTLLKVVLYGMAIFLLITSCDSPKLQSDLRACVTGSLPKLVDDALPAVIAALKNTEQDPWKDVQSSLLTRGVDLAICTIMAAFAELTRRPAPGAFIEPREIEGRNRGRDRARSFLARYGVVR